MQYSFLCPAKKILKTPTKTTKTPKTAKKSTQVINKSLFILIQGIYYMEIKVSKIQNTEQTELLNQHLKEPRKQNQ